MTYAWYPHPGFQQNVCSRWEFEVFAGGAAGPGKTDLLIMEAARHVDNPNYKAVLFRRTFPQLQEIIDRCHKYYPLIDAKTDYRAGEHRWYWPSGATINLSHMQYDASKYDHQGKEYQFLGFDELTQFLPTQYLYLFSRVRSTDQTIPARVRATSNPGGVGHQFTKDRFKIGLVEPGETIWDERSGLSRVFIPGLLEDNPSLSENDPGYLDRLELLPEVERQRLRFGIWDAFEGQVFQELNQKVHGFPRMHELPQDWEYFRSFDWGYSKPFSVGWWGVDFDNNLYRVRSWYGNREDVDDKDVGLKMSDVEIARGIKKREAEMGVRVKPGPADPSIWSKNPRKSVKGPPTAEVMQREGIIWLKGDNDRLNGKRQLHHRLQLNDEGLPTVFFSNDDEHFWRTMPLLRENERNPEDVDTASEDHIYDEVRYALMSRPMKPHVTTRSTVGTFQHERSKLIRAKAIAARYGVSLHDAYGKV